MRKLSFTIGWKSTLLTALVIPLCISLGLWQLDRADEKTVIAAMYDKRQTMAPLSLVDVDEYDDKTFLPVIIEGEFNGQHLLLENQWRQKKLGVDVLSVFVTQQEKWVLVNRGWLANKDRSQTPSFTTPEGQVRLFGSVYQPSKAPYSLGDLVLSVDKDIQRMAYLDIPQISAAFGQDFFPFSVRLSASNSQSFDTQWPEINVKPETHVGYAVQWFLFAALAFIVFIFANSNLGSLLRKRDR